MGTHPIFESDFDCLTDRKMRPLLWLCLAAAVVAEEEQVKEKATPKFVDFEKLEIEPRGKILVLYEKANLNITHSVWLANVARAGEVVLKSAIDPNLKLDKYDVNIYHAVFLMAPGVEHFGGNVTEQTFVEYVQRGGNLFVAADSTIGSAIGEVAALFGVEYDQPGRKVVSHIQEDNTFDRDSDHTAFMLKASFAYMGPLLSVYGDNRYYSMPWMNSIGMHIPEEHATALPLVKCNENCYTDDLSFKPIKPGKLMTKFKGRNICLMAILQEEFSRVVFASSMDVFSDETMYRHYVKYYREASVTDQSEKGMVGQEGIIDSQNSTPKLLVNALGWLLQQKNQYKVTAFRHYKVDDIEQTKKFYVNETVRFEVRISELVDGFWLPLLNDEPHTFQAELKLVQPFIRAPLVHRGDGRYMVDMRLPDVNGVFTFDVEVTSPGFNLIHLTQKVVVNPTPYNHYPRFLECAYPYYLSAISMMTGVFFMSFVFLYHDKSNQKNSKKNK